MGKHILIGDNIVEYNHPLAEEARSLAHSGSWGTKDILVICSDNVKRHITMLALIEWCSDQHWTCNEYKPGRFNMRGGTFIEFARDSTSEHLDGKTVKIHVIE